MVGLLSLSLFLSVCADLSLPYIVLIVGILSHDIEETLWTQCPSPRKMVACLA